MLEEDKKTSTVIELFYSGEEVGVDGSTCSGDV